MTWTWRWLLLTLALAGCVEPRPAPTHLSHTQAKKLNGLAKVVAVNCDEEHNKALCSRFGVRGGALCCSDLLVSLVPAKIAR